MIVRIDREIQDIVPRFLDNRRKDAARLRELAASGSLDEAERLGHSMIGSGGGYGFKDIMEIGSTIEAAAQIRDVEAVLQCADDLLGYLDNLEVVYE